MTLKELKEKAAESPNKEWFQNLAYSFSYPHLNLKLPLKGVSAIYEFTIQQIEGFNILQELPSELEAVKKRFKNVGQRIITLVTNDNVNEHEWNNNLALIAQNNPPVFLYNSPETEFLIKVSKEHPKHYPAAYEYISGTINSINNKNHFIGYLLAYEFTSKDFSLISERKDAEKKSIATIRSDFQKKLGDAESQMTEYLAEANSKCVEYSKKVDELKTEKENLYNQWFQGVSKSVNEFNTNSAQRIKDFEDLYKEKLKLEAPAKYWSDRAKGLRKEGYLWLIGLMVCIGTGVAILIWVLNKISDGAFQQIFAETSIAIKWSIALITLISFLAYAIRTFSKLTFSSFHLVRDAEEREQLTYVYLALQKEKGIDKTERHLIMQSLFSRADSGLLKDDASPTMPGNIVDQMTRK